MTSKTTIETNRSKRQKYRPFQLNERMEPSGSITKARSVAKAIASELMSRFGATKVMLFGSLASGNFNRWSDIDLAVWGISAADYYRAVAFAIGFSNDWNVDIVDVDDCSDSLRRIILKEGISI